MRRFILLKFQLLRIFTLSGAIFLSMCCCHNLWASQDAMVIVDDAVIYADEQMSAPVGYVRKGKKVKVGEISRNKSQVYPVIVSGKISYIRVIDVSTEKDSMNSNTLVAERFKKGTIDENINNYSVGLFNYATQINLNLENGKLKDKDPMNWTGLGVRGGTQINPKWDLDVLINYMKTNANNEAFSALEIGLGAAARIFEKSRFTFRFLAQFLLVPFSTYALGEDFRVNGYGFSTGAGLSMTYKLAGSWGLEGYGGFYYTKLSGFKAPTPYRNIEPSFLGSRIGLSLNYQF
jgi:hypothetical protein